MSKPNAIDVRLEQVAEQERLGLMTHVVLGYPSLQATVDLVRAMDQAGVDLVEMQIPFSDPMADGPSIRRASEAALANGTRVADAFTVARQLSDEVSMPLLFMGYFNTVYKYGVDKFCADASNAGISGLIIPDVPLEEAEYEGFLAACEANNLHNIVTLAPASTTERIAKNAAAARGFVYCMSRQGTTGAGQGLDPQLQAYLEHVGELVDVPMAVGFGISSRERVEMIRPYCDIAVVGSALLDIIRDCSPEEITDRVTAFLHSLTKDDR